MSYCGGLGHKILLVIVATLAICESSSISVSSLPEQQQQYQQLQQSIDRSILRGDNETTCILLILPNQDSEEVAYCGVEKYWVSSLNKVACIVFASTPALLALIFCISAKTNNKRISTSNLLPQKNNVSLGAVLLIIVVVWEAIAFGLDLKLFLMLETGSLVSPFISRLPIIQAVLITFTVLRSIKLILFASLSPPLLQSSNSSRSNDEADKIQERDEEEGEKPYCDEIPSPVNEKLVINTDACSLQICCENEKNKLTQLLAEEKKKNQNQKSSMSIIHNENDDGDLYHNEAMPIAATADEELLEESPSCEEYSVPLIKETKPIYDMMAEDVTVDSSFPERHQNDDSTMTTIKSSNNNNNSDKTSQSCVVESVVAITVFVQQPLTLVQYFYVEKYASSSGTLLAKAHTEIVIMCVALLYLIIDYDAKRVGYTMLKRLSAFFNVVVFLWVSNMLSYHVFLRLLKSNRFEKACLQVDQNTGELYPTPFNADCLTSHEKSMLVFSVSVMAMFVLINCVIKLAEKVISACHNKPLMKYAAMKP